MHGFFAGVSVHFYAIGFDLLVITGLSIRIKGRYSVLGLRNRDKEGINKGKGDTEGIKKG